MAKNVALAGLLLGCALAPSANFAQEVELPFSMPIPTGWRTETLPFPLEFAPDLPYSGLEELRFAPGMFEETSEELWSYAFVWWIGEAEPVDAASLTLHLEAYFRGLAHAVGESRGFEVGNATFGAEIEDHGDGRFAGHAETFDAFVTRGQMNLKLRGRVLECPSQASRAVLFSLSPQPFEHPIWRTLDSITDGFRCVAPLARPQRSELHDRS